MKAILFDAGNTLLHLDYPWLAALAERLGCQAVTADEVGAAVAAVCRRGWPAVAADARPTAYFAGYFGAIGEALGLALSAAQAFAAAVEAEHLSATEGIWRTPAPHVQEVLSALQARGLKLGVVSNADGRVEGQLAAAGLRPWLKVVVDSYLVGVEKPDPRIFHIALRLLGTDGADTLYVGDLRDVDVDGATAAGLCAVLYDRWDAYPELRQGRIRSLLELLDLPLA